VPHVNEFELIDRFLTRATPASGFVHQGVGDDCALLDCGDRLLAVTTDLLLEGRHFLVDADPEALGHKALAVNLSDLAAAGATPRAFQLALALPRADEKWLAAFTRGLFRLADAYSCALVGGDTTRVPQLETRAAQPLDGPLTLCITAIGELPRQAARGRAGAQAGDDLWVSGTLGDAGAALAWRRGELPGLAQAEAIACAARMDRPEPRVALGVALRGLATAAIDLSDGLMGDLGHILQRSQVGAHVDCDRLPRSAALRKLPLDAQRRFALAGGDDYELLFTAPAARRGEVEALTASGAVPLTRIGFIDAVRELVLHDADGRRVEIPWRSFDHFSG
jgi:thiamine-monophosphate kinase